MKIVFAYYLVSVYMIAICKPIFPVVKDLFAHVFWGIEHIATVHHHDGEFHVDRELSEHPADSENDQNRQVSWKSDQLSLHILLKHNYDFAYNFSTIQMYYFRSSSFKAPFLEINSPPPKLLS